MTLKADVLTHHWVPNFGANLQAYATARMLTDLGVQVRFCNFRPIELERIYRESVPERQVAAHESFVSGHLRQSRKIATQKDFEDLAREESADFYVSGSDAVFRLKPGTQRADWVFPNPYWLVGLNDLRLGRTPRKFALAASAMGCGFGHLSDADRKRLCSAVDEMDAVSVRDEWTRAQLRKTGVSNAISIVPDPVVSLVDQIRELAAKNRTGRPYILVSTQGTVSRKWVESFSSLCESNGYETVGLPLPEGTVDDAVSRSLALPLDPLDWLKQIAGCSGYVGVRFHPVLCAIAAGAPVIALDRYYRNFVDARRSKTHEVMKVFGLSDACFGAWQKFRLRPGRAFAMLEKQSGGIGEREETLQRMRNQLQSFVVGCFNMGK